MATLVLSAAGAAVGGAFSGSVLGVTGAMVGRAVGATIGQGIDQRLLGGGAQAVETGRIDRYRIRGAGEGTVLPRLFGRMRVPGQVIWATRYVETAQTSGGGGKGTARQPSVTQYSYSVSLALALCEGPILRVGRIWADGEEIAKSDLSIRVYPGDATQLPDPRIEAVEGAGQAPAFRGTAYIVIEDLDLSRFGNRVPQFNFEVVRLAEPDGAASPPLAKMIRAVALIPGSGEYALDPAVAIGSAGPGQAVALNEHTARGQSDFAAALEDLTEELPNCRSVSLVVSWFGDDLRCGACSLRPLAEPGGVDATGQAWSVAGLDRAAAGTVPDLDGQAVYGGTPSDGSVIAAIQALRVAGQSVVYYPFVLMTQLAGNGVPDPWGGAEQAALPWRGRITLSAAPGQVGSPDGSAVAEAEIDAFFGAARASDFAIGPTGVSYAGPPDWGYRRFVLHQAALCAAAGGVGAFCLGSELRPLTCLRGADGRFPFVEGLRDLAGEVRALLGPEVKLGYAADWTEYGAYVPQDGSGDVLFPLDALWADPRVDFIGIDAYAPLADWRDGADHADAAAGVIHDRAYLQGNVEGGEGYDWFYPHPADRAAQRRVPIRDTAHGEDWVFRPKDLRGWWQAAHHPRHGGVRADAPTAWVPGSKPIWLTEIGCPAVDKGANAPNRFYDPKSSESALPDYSSGARDDLIQQRALKAMLAYWQDNNATSPLDGRAMIDLDRIHVWAWDARPWPVFPSGGVWGDAANYERGHWLTGRVTAQELGDVIAAICARAGIAACDVSQVHGLVRGYLADDLRSARAHLQSLVVAHGLDAVERDGKLVFRSRRVEAPVVIPARDLVAGDDAGADVMQDRADPGDVPDRVVVDFIAGDGSFDTRSVAAFRDGGGPDQVEKLGLPLALTEAEGRYLAERALTEMGSGRDGLRFGVAPSRADLRPGQVMMLDGVVGLHRIERIEDGLDRQITAVRITEAVHGASDLVASPALGARFVPALPVLPLFLDLPLMTGSERPEAPHLALAAQPWPGSVAVYAADQPTGFSLEMLQHVPAVVGVTETPLYRADPARVDRGAGLSVRLIRGALEAVEDAALLAGANLFAIGDGTPGGWELFQARDVVLQGDGTYALSHRLRGRFGSDVEMGDPLPPGSYVVKLGPEVVQLDLTPAQIGHQRHYRIGPSAKPYDHTSYTAAVHAFEGRGLRPLRPCHLRTSPVGPDLEIRFARRGRIGADRWDLPDIPLGEAQEAYVLWVETQAGQVLRRVDLTEPRWIYDAAAQAADGGAAGKVIAVAQMSDSHGLGPVLRSIIA